MNMIEQIEGVTLLNTDTVIMLNAIDYLFIILFAVIIITSLGILILLRDEKELAIDIGAIFLIIFFTWSASMVFAEGTYQTYQTTIENESSFIEILENYDVYNVEGKLYTLVDKESIREKKRIEENVELK